MADSYIRPTDLDDALRALSARPWMVLAGGTDFFPARVGRPIADDVLDVTGLESLTGIVREDKYWRIGARATWTDLIRAPLPTYFDGFKQAAREVGGAQIQNAGTIVGNVCNASPAADGIPNLLALDAEVELASIGGVRCLPIGDFVLGNRRIARRSDELVTALIVPIPPRAARGHFLKLGARKYLVISIVMAAAVIGDAGDGTVGDARVALGACSAVAKRLPMLEAALLGRPIDARLGEVVAEAHLAPISPIDDIRGTAVYRRDAALTALRRMLSDLGAGP